MKTTTLLLFTTILSISFAGCNEHGNRQYAPESAGETGREEVSIATQSELGNKENPLYGIVYRDIKEIMGLSNYTHLGGSVISSISKRKPDGDYRFALVQYKHNDDHYCFFVELLDRDESGKVNYKILDTVHVGKIREDEDLSICTCLQGTIPDDEIIAVVKSDFKKEYYDEIVRAWRADTDNGKFRPIKHTREISCINEGYGVN
jgi:hypothetical protein